MRIDQRLAEKWISPNSSVLDLGCGDGELLAHMSKQHNIRAYGLEIDQEKIAIANILIKTIPTDIMECYNPKIWRNCPL